MTSQNNTARKLAEAELDYINYSDVHPHNPKKIIAFTGAQAAVTAAAPHPSMVSRHRRMMQRYTKQYKLLVACPRYLSVALLGAFLYLRLGMFPDGAFAALNLLWIGAYALAGSSFLFSKLLKKPAHTEYA